ncbi:MAG: hydroxyacid dehydrogenase [Betaproteobacteria bacterium]|nr:hydroxyacid dehydrogenase [Betaproteobacteria bacterium]
MPVARIIITEFMDLPSVQRLQAVHEVVYDPKLVDQPGQLILLARDADVLVVRNRTQVRGELLAALERCRIVGRLGVGLDNIDVHGCEARGMTVMPATGANALSVAEYVIATAMLLLRRAYQCADAVAQGQWPRQAASQGLEADGKTLGLVGFGAIGQLTARLARGLGLKIQAHDPMMPASHPAYAEQQAACVDLETLLATSDVVSLHVPLVDSTRHLINADRLARMRAHAVLINTARGGVVDEQAVAEALRAHRLGGAALDVFEQEPLPATPHFAGCPNLILTPHIAGVSTESNERVSSLIAERILQALGSPSA